MDRGDQPNTEPRRLVALILLLAMATACSDSNDGFVADQPAPEPEPIDVQHLPLPPTAPDDAPGSCSNPTGSISASDTGIAEGPGYTWDGRHVLLPIEFAGAPAGSTATGPRSSPSRPTAPPSPAAMRGGV